MPSADFRYAMGVPYGLLTRLYACCCMPIFVFPPPCGVRLAGGQDAIPTGAGVLVYRFSLLIRLYFSSNFRGVADLPG